jgi:hypothetical protein
VLLLKSGQFLLGERTVHPSEEAQQVVLVEEELPTLQK